MISNKIYIVFARWVTDDFCIQGEFPTIKEAEEYIKTSHLHICAPMYIIEATRYEKEPK